MHKHIQQYANTIYDKDKKTGGPVKVSVGEDSTKTEKQKLAIVVNFLKWEIRDAKETLKWAERMLRLCGK